MTYTITAANPDNDKCYCCGEPATILIVADRPEPETGHVDTITLCEDCWQQEYANKMEMN